MAKKKTVTFEATNQTRQDWTRFAIYSDRSGDRLATADFDKPVGPGESFTGTLTITFTEK